MCLAPVRRWIALLAACVLAGCLTAVVGAGSARGQSLRTAPARVAIDGTGIGNVNTTVHGSAVLTRDGVQHAYFVAQPTALPDGTEQKARLIDATPTASTSTELEATGYDVAADTSLATPTLFVTSGSPLSVTAPAAVRVYAWKDGAFAKKAEVAFAGSTGYTATSIVVDPVKHRGFVSLSNVLDESYIGWFDTDDPTTSGIVDAQTTASLRMSIDLATHDVYFAEQWGTTLRRVIWQSSTELAVQSLGCMQLGDIYAGAVASAGGTIFVADISSPTVVAFADVSASGDSCTQLSSIDLATTDGWQAAPSDLAVSAGPTAKKYQLFVSTDQPCPDDPSTTGCVASYDVSNSVSYRGHAGVHFGVQALLVTTPPGASVATALAAGQDPATNDVDIAAVAADIAVGVRTVSPTTLPDATADQLYSATVAVTGGSDLPVVSAAWHGAAPPGLAVVVNFGGVTVTGTPATAAQSVQYTLDVTVEGVTTPVSLTVVPPPPGCAQSPAAAAPYTATSSYECDGWSLATLKGGSSPSGYRSAGQPANTTRQVVSVDLGMTTRVTSLTIKPAGTATGAFPTGARVLLANSPSCSSGAAVVTGALSADSVLQPPSEPYRYVCVVVTSLPAQDAAGGWYFALGSFTVTVCQCATFSPSVLPHGRVGTAYAQTVSFDSGSASTRGQLNMETSPRLPTGLSFRSQGMTSMVLTGTPRAAGAASIVATGTAAAQRSSQRYSIVVNPIVAFADAVGGALTLSNALACRVLLGCDYDTVVRAVGGAGLTVSLAPGSSLPAGLEIVQVSDGTWHIRGRLSSSVAAGTYPLSLVARDADADALPVGGSATVTTSVTVQPPAASFSPAALPSATVGRPYDETIKPDPSSASLYLRGGGTGYGLSVSVQGAPGSQYVSITGTPSADLTVTAYTFDVCVTGSPDVCRTYAITAKQAPADPGPAGCEHAGETVRAPDSAMTLIASTSHECDDYSLRALLFDPDPDHPTAAPSPAGLSGFVGGVGTAPTQSTLTADLGDARTITSMRLGAIQLPDTYATDDYDHALPANPVVRLSAASATCDDDASVAATVSTSGNAMVVTPPSATPYRYVCLTATTVPLGERFGAPLAGKYGFALGSFIVDTTAAVQPDTAAAPTVQITRSVDEHTVAFEGDDWIDGGQVQVFLDCWHRTDCSTALPGDAPATGSATAPRTMSVHDVAIVNGHLSGQITFPAGYAESRVLLWQRLSVLETLPRNSGPGEVLTASLALERATAGLDLASLVSLAGMAPVHAEDRSQVSVTAYDATGTRLSVAVQVDQWSDTSWMVDWPSDATVGWVRFDVALGAGRSISYWWDKSGQLYFTSPFPPL
jgi:hypothetical protein